MNIDDAEVFADEIDRAAQISSWATDEAIRRQQSLAKPEQVQLPDGSWPVLECLDCGETIPEGRLKHGRVRCIDCQTIKEKKGAGYGTT